MTNWQIYLKELKLSNEQLWIQVFLSKKNKYTNKISKRIPFSILQTIVENFHDKLMYILDYIYFVVFPSFTPKHETKYQFLLKTNALMKVLEKSHPLAILLMTLFPAFQQKRVNKESLLCFLFTAREILSILRSFAN